MKSTALDRPAEGVPAAIVQLAGAAHPLPEDQVVARARAFAEPLLAGQLLDTGEPVLAHADGVGTLLRDIGAAPAMCAAAYLVYAGDHLQRPEDVVRKGFGDSYASLVTLTRQLVQIQRAARLAQQQPAAARAPERRAEQVEPVRKMLLAFSRDLRVVLLRLASRLQTLRWHAASRTPCPAAIAEESLQVFAPLANRLGIWQIKWALEDLSFRFLQPAEYHRIAKLVDETRAAREASVAAARAQLAAQLRAAGLEADVQGRPKHLYSIWKKMQGKQLGFERVLDVRALRVIVADAPACYAALAQVHALWTAIDGEFDDYIARPKPNGYQSLHTVVRDADGRPLEVQIRTRAMHEHAEHGVAAHWMYKEAGTRGYAGVAAAGDFEERVAEARKAVLRELLAWERDLSGADPGTGAAASDTHAFDDRIYVFTPQARIIELPAGGTPLDFAYMLHTELGHRCRGARVDGALVPLNTPLRHGQTVDIVSAKEGGPSRDWLQADAGYLASPRARAKVRAWFNAEQQQATIARGRELVEKLLQREGRTALKLDALAEQCGFADAEALFSVVGKDEYSLRHIEQLLRPAEPAPAEDEVLLRRPRGDAGPGRGGVLVVGVDSLLTTLARCCRPAPPDAIAGFVTRGKGVAIHRADCDNLRHMAERWPGRVIEVAWGAGDPARGAAYPLDLAVEADDRPGLLRDISDLLAKEKLHVTAVQSARRGAGAARAARRGGAAAGTWMSFTVEVDDATRLPAVLARLAAIPGVRHARRK